MKRAELITSKEYVIAEMQLKLLNLIEGYMKKNNLNRNELAQQLQVTKGYISQLLNVSFDHKLSKVVELALACNTMPLLFFTDLDNFVKDDANDKYYELMPIVRPIYITYEKSFTLNPKINKKSNLPTPLTINKKPSFSVESNKIDF